MHFSPTPHSVFNRHALVLKPLKHVLDYMDPMEADHENDREWLALLEKHGL